MGVDVLATCGISNYDIHFVEPDQFGPHTLRVNKWCSARHSVFRCAQVT